MDLDAMIDLLEEIWMDLDATIDLLDENPKSSGRFPISTFVEALGSKWDVHVVAFQKLLIQKK